MLNEIYLLFSNKMSVLFFYFVATILQATPTRLLHKSRIYARSSCQHSWIESLDAARKKTSESNLKAAPIAGYNLELSQLHHSLPERDALNNTETVSVKQLQNSYRLRLFAEVSSGRSLN